MRLFERTGEWLVTAYAASDRQLSLARIVFAGYMLFLVGVPSFAWIADAPDVLFNPPFLSPANILTGWPPDAVMYLLSLGVLVGFVLLLFGIATRFVSIALGVVLLAGYNLAYSFGKIDHSILQPAALLVMSVSGWGNRYRLFPRGEVAERRDRNAAALGILAILIGFAYLSAALPKISGGWLDPGSQAVRGWVTLYSNIDGGESLLAGPLLAIDAPWFWEAFDWAAVGLETLIITAVPWPRLFRAFLFVAVLFHVANWLLLNIAFAINLSIYALFVQWQPWLDRVGLGRPRVWNSGTRWVALGAVAALVVGAWVLLATASDADLRTQSSVDAALLVLVMGSGASATVMATPMVLGWAAAIALAWMALLPRGRVIVVWDDSCSFCAGWVRWFRRLDWNGVIDLRPLSGPMPEGVTRAEAEDALQVVLPDGSVHAGFQAVRRIAERLPLTFPVSPFLGLVSGPGDRIYRKVAARRTCGVSVPQTPG